MKKPFPAYRGTEPYVFVCYAHSDAARVYADLEALNSEGINLWYDEGITAGSSWRAEIATAIKGASRFLFFISGASLQSTHCLREVDFALNNEIEIVPIYLDDSTLPGELELALSRLHALFRESDSMYMDHLLSSLKGGSSERIERQKPPSKITKKRAWLALPVLAVLLLSLFFWSQWNSSPGGKNAVRVPSGAPTAYDHYLEGLELLQRWDQGDNLDTAISLFQKASEIDPDFALAYARLANALRMRYALTGEVDFLEQATANINEAVRLNPELGPVQVTLGRIHEAKGNFDLAFAALERALAIDPNDAVANQAIAKVYARQGRLQDADASYKRALALDPDNPAMHDSYANFLADQGRYEEALKEWQTTIRLAPDHYAARVNMGGALTETGRLPEAITMYQQANEIKPSYMAYSNLGTAYARSGRLEEAVDAYRKALEFDETNWLAWGNLAYVYSWMNGMDEQAKETFATAIRLAEAAKENNPRDAYIFSDLSLYYAKTGQQDRAIQNLESALAFAPDSGEILGASAEALEILGLRERAIEMLQRALQAGFTRQQMQRNPEFSELLTDPRMQDVH